MVAGRDLGWVTQTRFFVAGKQVAGDVRAPFRAVLPSTLFGGAVATVRVHVRTLDSRGMTITCKITLPQP